VEGCTGSIISWVVLYQRGRRCAEACGHRGRAEP